MGRGSFVGLGRWGTVDSVVPSDFGQFFAATAAVAGALVGLLFVAISVAPARDDPETRLEMDIRAGVAFSALVNTLTVALFALIPGDNLGITVTVVALASISSCVALGIVLVRDEVPGPKRRRQVAFLVVQTLIFVYEVVLGVLLTSRPHDLGLVRSVCVLMIVLFLVGIARAWQLIGARDVGLFTEVVRSLRARQDSGTGTST
jgi:small-conductance mechanosensitive channel